MPRLSAFALALLLALGFAVPSTFAEEEPAPAPMPKPKEDVAEKPAGPVFKLVSNGAEPRMTVRYAPKADTKIVLKAAVHGSFNFGGMAAAFGPIDVHINAGFGAGSVAGNSSIAGELKSVVMNADPSDPMAPMFKPMIDGLTGVTFTGEFNGQGKWTSHPLENLKGVPGSSAQFAQMIGLVLNSIITDVPADAIGVGASWTYTTKTQKRNHVRTYTVKSMKSGRVVLEASDVATGSGGRFNAAGMSATISKFKIATNSTTHIDTELGFVVKSEMKWKNASETVEMGNVEIAVSGKSETKVEGAETEDPMAGMAAMGMPGAGHAPLKELAGEWHAAGKFWMGGPDPTETKGTCTNKMILGGRFLKTTYETQFPGMPGPFQGSGLFGYNNLSKQYEMLWLDNMASGMNFIKGSASADGKTITFKGTSESTMGTFPVRHVYKLIDKNTHEFESYMTQGDKEMLAMKIVYTRK